MTDPKSPSKPASKPPADKPAEKPAEKAADKPATPGKPPALDERKLRMADLAPHAAALAPAELVELLRDGRAIVRANAVLGLAVVGHPAPEMVPLLRDSDTHVAQSTAQAIATLGRLVRPLVPAIVQALDTAQPEVLDAGVGALAELMSGGGADDELTTALDVPLELAHKTVNAAAGRVGRGGIAFLIRAAAADRSRVRINAVAGLGRFGKLDPDAALGFLGPLETSDPVPDVRTAVKAAMLAIVAREKQQAVD